MKAKFVAMSVLFLSLLSSLCAEDASRVYLRLTRLAEKGQAKDVSIGFAGKVGQEMAGFWYPRYGEPLAVVMTVVSAGEEPLIALWFYNDFATIKLPPEKLHYVSAKWDASAPFTFAGSKFVLEASRKGWPRESRRHAARDVDLPEARAIGGVLYSTGYATMRSALHYCGIREEKAQQGARANAGICHAACYGSEVEMKPQIPSRDAARGAPNPGVAHL